MATLLNGALMTKIANVAIAGVMAAASHPNTAIQPNQVVQSQSVIAAKVKDAIASDPELQNLTGTEAWYQKRSRWAAIVATGVAILAPIAAHYGWTFGTGEQELATAVLTAGGGLWAAYLAYRAGTASKPLGA
jgi:hypothetical protein